MSKKKLAILVVGSSGQLGSEISDLQGFDDRYHFIFMERETLDISCYLDLESFFINCHIDVVINCAAYTNVVEAEKEAEMAEAVNARGVMNLARLAKRYSIKLIHISTDSVFDGEYNHPYEEGDATNPVNVYSRSKLKGEKAMLAINPENSIIIRTSWVYSKHGNNFVKTMLELGRNKKSIKVVYDQIGTPTSAKDLAGLILEILPSISFKEVEIYHYSNEGTISWYDFAKEIFAYSGINCEVEPISTIDYGAAVKRPYYSVLSKRKIKNDFHITIPFWKDSLMDCLDELRVVR